MHTGNVDVLVVTTPWCHHCAAMRPVLDRLADEHRASLRFQFIDASVEPERAEALAVRGTPTVIVQVDGDEVARQVGRTSDDDLRAFIESHGARRPFPADAAWRGGAALALIASGLVLGTPALTAIGGALGLWAAATMWRWTR